MSCPNNNCRHNPSSNSKAPCENCRTKEREAKGRAGSPQQNVAAIKDCQTCKRSFPRHKLTNGTCQSCLTKHKILELLIKNNSPSEAQEVLFVMHFDTLGQLVLYKSFFTTDSHQELCKALKSCIHPDERQIFDICALDVHNVYNTGGDPLDHNHIYMNPLRSLLPTTLRVLISYVGQTSTDLRVNVEHYAHTASQYNAIDFCFLVFERTSESVEKTESPEKKLDLIRNGTKAGVLQTLHEIYLPDHLRFADDSDDHCTSVQSTFPNAHVRKINARSQKIELEVIEAILYK